MFVCCYNVVKGGGVNISIKFTEFLLKKGEVVYFLYPYNDYYITEVSRLNNYSNFRPIKFYKIFNFLAFKPFINYFFLPFYVLLLNPQKIFNFGNIAFPSLKPQFLLMHNAFLIAGNDLFRKFDFKESIYLRLMTFFIKINLKYASIIGVQTNTILNCIKEFKPNLDIILIPNTVDVLPSNLLRSRGISKTIKLLFLSKYYAHKNFEILFTIAEKLRLEDIKIFLTLDPNIKIEYDFLNKIKDKNIDDVVINIGYINNSDLSEIYSQYDGLFLPTLLESFSTTYIESFNYKVPIFTSKMNFAIEICQDAAFYFDPLDGDDIINTIKIAFKDPDNINKKILRGSKLLNEFEDQNLVFGKIYCSI